MIMDMTTSFHEDGDHLEKARKTGRSKDDTGGAHSFCTEQRVQLMA